MILYCSQPVSRVIGEIDNVHHTLCTTDVGHDSWSDDGLSDTYHRHALGNLVILSGRGRGYLGH